MQIWPCDRGGKTVQTIRRSLSRPPRRWGINRRERHRVRTGQEW